MTEAVRLTTAAYGGCMNTTRARRTSVVRTEDVMLSVCSPAAWIKEHKERTLAKSYDEARRLWAFSNSVRGAASLLPFAPLIPCRDGGLL